MQFLRAPSADARQVCIIVNPQRLGAPAQAMLERDRRVIIFDDLERFDRWRSRCRSAGNLACEVVAALRELGCDRAQLPLLLQQALERLTRLAITPTVHEFLRSGDSERTLYRRWNAILPVRPKRFLDRVRFLHALRLIEEEGASVKEAAALAGYGCADRFRADARKAAARCAPDVRNRRHLAGIQRPHRDGLHIFQEQT